MIAVTYVLGLLFITFGSAVDSGGGGPVKTVVVDDEIVITTDVEAVAGLSAYLPCNMTPPTPSDRVTLVIWYKQGKTSPIYSYDLRRSAPVSEKSDAKKLDGAHWSDDKTLEGRAHFSVSQQPAELVLNDVVNEDGAVYKCRVDFKKSPTRNSKVNLTVILPPDQVSVLNEKGEHVLHYMLGPYKEGVTIDITCIASGGHPPPRVTWWLENALIDETYEILPDRQVKNVLRLERLERRHLNAVFTCQASNNNLVPPISSAVTLDMILRPLSIQLVGKNRPLSAGTPANASCRVSGAKPPPIVTWWKDGVQMTDAKQSTSSDGNTTTSVLMFTPVISDSDKTISCHAESGQPEDNTDKFNKLDQKLSLAVIDSSDGWKLNICHVPVVKLELGPNINSSAIQEGLDVYFECSIKSNPWIYRVTWKHNGKLLNHNLAAGTIVSNQSLVLQKVTRSRAGTYTCVGSNQEGDGESNPVNLDVKFAPVCRSGKERVQGVGRLEAAKVVCEVDANPSNDLRYTWRFNNSRETIHLDRNQYTEEGPRSTIAYTPLTPLDYGTLMCWASNQFGKQTEPCVYRVIAAGRPDCPANCSVMNQTSTSLEVRCLPGFDGGLGQRFIMEVYERHGQSLAANITAGRPAFTANDLPSGLGFDISVYAFNNRGPSDPVQLHAYTLKSAEKRTAITPKTFYLSPMHGIIIVSAMGFIIILACFIAVTVAMLRRRGRRRRRRSPDNAKTAIFDGDGSAGIDGSTVGNGTDGGDHQQEEGSDDSLEKNPDIIPHDDDDLDEDEKAFERLNSGRMYSSRILDVETCKQQARELLPPPMPLLMPVTQNQHGRYMHVPAQSVPGAGPYRGPMPRPMVDGSTVAAYPNPVLGTLPPPQLQQQQQQQQHQYYQQLGTGPLLQQQQQYHPRFDHQHRPQAMRAAVTDRHLSHDRSVQVPLLPAAATADRPMAHQRESTTCDQAFAEPTSSSQIVAATRF